MKPIPGVKSAPRSVLFSERIYQRLLRLYPRAHLVEYELPMALLFHDLCLEAYRRKQTLGVFGLWVRMAPDLGASIGAEHWSELRRYWMNKPASNQGIDPAAGLGLLVAAALLAGGVLAKAWITGSGGSPALAALVQIGAFFISAVIMELLVRTGGAILAASGIVVVSLLLPLLWVPDPQAWLLENPAGVGVIVFASSLWAKRAGRNWPIYAAALILAAAQLLISFL